MINSEDHQLMDQMTKSEPFNSILVRAFVIFEHFFSWRSIPETETDEYDDNLITNENCIRKSDGN